VAPLIASLKESTSLLPELEEQPSGELRVAASEDFGVAVLADIVAAFVARYPTVKVDMRLSNRIVDIVAEGFDVAIRLSPHRLRDSSLTARLAGTLRLQLFAAPSYLARRGTPKNPEDLGDHDWVVFGSGAKVVLNGPGGKIQMEPRGRLSSDDMLFLRQSVRLGTGIGMLPTFLADPDVATGELVRVLPRWNSVTGHVFVVLPSGRQVPKKATAFRDFVLEALRAHKGVDT
jgi:DNA-binding transcriptional LysR family regulator